MAAMARERRAGLPVAAAIRCASIGRFVWPTLCTTRGRRRRWLGGGAHARGDRAGQVLALEMPRLSRRSTRASAGRCRGRCPSRAGCARCRCAIHAPVLATKHVSRLARLPTVGAYPSGLHYALNVLPWHGGKLERLGAAVAPAAATSTVYVVIAALRTPAAPDPVPARANSSGRSWRSPLQPGGVPT